VLLGIPCDFFPEGKVVYFKNLPFKGVRGLEREGKAHRRKVGWNEVREITDSLGRGSDRGNMVVSEYWVAEGGNQESLFLSEEVSLS